MEVKIRKTLVYLFLDGVMLNKIEWYSVNYNPDDNKSAWIKISKNMYIKHLKADTSIWPEDCIHKDLIVTGCRHGYITEKRIVTNDITLRYCDVEEFQKKLVNKFKINQ